MPFGAFFWLFFGFWVFLSFLGFFGLPIIGKCAILGLKSRGSLARDVIGPVLLSPSIPFIG